MHKSVRPLQAAVAVLLFGVGTYSVASGTSSKSETATFANSFTGSATHQFARWHTGFRQPWQPQQSQYTPPTGATPTSSENSSSSSSGPNSTTLPTGTQGSENWAGYVDSPSTNGTSYTSVTGSWTVPEISDASDGVGAQWIGLGGVTNQDLLQVGTIEQPDSTGQIEANVFWEELPASADNVMTVPVGSQISTSIAEKTNDVYNISFSVKTPSGQTESKTISVTLTSDYAAGIGTSAEWISEDPSDQNDNLYPLANMGTVTYTDATVDGEAMNANGNQVQPIALVGDENQVLIAPSTVNSGGESFSTISLNSTSAEEGQTFPWGNDGTGAGNGWGSNNSGIGEGWSTYSGNWGYGEPRQWRSRRSGWGFGN